MARKAQARRQGSKGTPAWAWLLAGLLIGALAYFGYLQYQLLSAPQNAGVPIPETSGDAGRNANAGTEPPASGSEDGVLDTDYSFYDVLPTQETTDVADPADADPDATPTDQPPQAQKADAPPNSETARPVETARYLLQAGAFERNADADDLKARIAMAGEAARVESAEINGKTVYRVRLGPYADVNAAETAKANLSNLGIVATRIKMK